MQQLRDDGCTQEEIADQLDVSQTTVWIYTRDEQSYFNFSLANGYPSIQHGQNTVYIHRLLAAAEYDLADLKDKEVHHENEVTFDNRPSNISVLNPSDHREEHREAYR
jgi:orotate phosphoribosyltransferase-like protein